MRLFLAFIRARNNEQALFFLPLFDGTYKIAERLYRLEVTQIQANPLSKVGCIGYYEIHFIQADLSIPASYIKDNTLP